MTKAIRRAKRVAGYLLCLLGATCVVISLALLVLVGNAPAFGFVAGLFLLFGWFSLLLGWVMARKTPDP